MLSGSVAKQPYLDDIRREQAVIDRCATELVNRGVKGHVTDRDQADLNLEGDDEASYEDLAGEDSAA